METKQFIIGFVILVGFLLISWAVEDAMIKGNLEPTETSSNQEGTAQSPPNMPAEHNDTKQEEAILHLGNNNTEPTKQPPSTTPSTPAPPIKTKPAGITSAELAEHNSRSDCWVGYKGKVYDITAFLPLHPGGVSKILRYCGTSTEFTAAFNKQHKTSQEARLAREGEVTGELA